MNEAYDPFSPQQLICPKCGDTHPDPYRIRVYSAARRRNLRYLIYPCKCGCSQCFKSDRSKGNDKVFVVQKIDGTIHLWFQSRSGIIGVSR